MTDQDSTPNQESENGQEEAVKPDLVSETASSEKDSDSAAKPELSNSEVLDTDSPKEPEAEKIVSDKGSVDKVDPESASARKDSADKYSADKGSAVKDSADKDRYAKFDNKTSDRNGRGGRSDRDRRSDSKFGSSRKDDSKTFEDNKAEEKKIEKIEIKPGKVGQGIGLGKRKTSVARVRIKPGSGKFVINGRSLAEFFPNRVHRQIIVMPLKNVNNEKDFDVWVNVRGGGVSGQAGAVKHGISRALNLVDRDHNRPILKKAGFLTRDAREVERKKAGLHKARKAPQYSKR
jgi:small subunit ribosomal protein S9